MIDQALCCLLLRPYDYQIEGARFLWNAKYALVGDQMGIGKSLTALIIATAHILENGGDARIIVCCPAFLKGTWEREIDKFCFHFSVLCCNTTKQIPDSWGSKTVMITNYEQLPYLRHLYKKATMVIVDEAHYAKNMHSSRTTALHDYIGQYNVERLLLLTGTPIKNDVPEFYSLLKLLDKDRSRQKLLVGDIKTHLGYCKKFCEIEKCFDPRRGPYDKFVGFRNKEEFKKLLEGRYIRRLSKDVLDLPKLSYQLMPMPSTVESEILGAELEKLWELYQSGNADAVMATRKKDSAIYKVPHTVSIVENLLSQGEDPILVFSDHIDSIDVLHKKFSRSEVITGETPMAKRDKIVQDFQVGKIPVLCATIGTMSAGWTLTRSRNMVFNDLPWVPGDLLQAVKRFHRIGQAHSCNVFVVQSTELDKTILGALRKKSEVIERVVN